MVFDKRGVRRTGIQPASHGFNVITNTATTADGVIPEEPTNRVPAPTSLPRMSDPTYTDKAFLDYINHYDAAGSVITETTAVPDAQGRPAPPTATFNTGRQRMISQMHSGQWNPMHPGAGDATATTATDYAAHGKAPAAKPIFTRQDTMASTMSMAHPTPTAKASAVESGSYPEPPQRVCPSLVESQSLNTAGNLRKNVSEHWTRDFDMSLRGNADERAAATAATLEARKASQTKSSPAVSPTKDTSYQPVYTTLLHDNMAAEPPTAADVMPTSQLSKNQTDGVLSSLRGQLLRISDQVRPHAQEVGQLSYP